jgi:tetratricopeptide (TPR) repeat protein
MPTPFLSSEEYDERAHQLYNEGQYEEALEVLREGLALYPHAVELHIGVGYARLAREEYAWGRRSFEEALVLDPEHEDALAGLGETLMKFGQQEAGVKTFRRILELGYRDDLDLSGPIELIVTSVKPRAARCQLPESGHLITLRASRLWDVVPGVLVTVKPRKHWRHAGHPYLSGEIKSVRFDPAALGLTPLPLEAVGMWDPQEEYWGEDDEPIEEWAKPIIARGARPELRMEQVLVGDSDDPFDDPILQSNELKDMGDRAGAEKLLMDLCDADLRCLDAHAHLGNLRFDHDAEDAIRHYEVGVGIGQLSLDDDFEGVLSWQEVDNRPFLRCLHGYGLCLWRLGRLDEAERVFTRLLWLSPDDSLGVRFLIDPVRAGVPWRPDDTDDRMAVSTGVETADLTRLQDTAPWEWPADARDLLLGVLRQPGADEAQRRLAAELASAFVVLDDEVAETLLAVTSASHESEIVRGQAALSLGPALEHADVEGFEDPDDIVISERTFRSVVHSLRKLYRDPGVPSNVRRYVFEASVRAPQDWHMDAIRAAYTSEDPTWRVSAVFAMRWVRGFDAEILQALMSEDDDIKYEAVHAAGNWSIDAAWPHIAQLITSGTATKALRLAAIEAAPSIRSDEASVVLADVLDSGDDDIVAAAHEAMAIAMAMNTVWPYDAEDEDDGKGRFPIH